MSEPKQPTPLFSVTINGSKGEMYVTDKGNNRYLCLFKNSDKADYINSYDAFGFTACTNEIDGEPVVEYFPIRLRKETRLTTEIMQNVWSQIAKQL